MTLTLQYITELECCVMLCHFILCHVMLCYYVILRLLTALYCCVITEMSSIVSYSAPLHRAILVSLTISFTPHFILVDGSYAMYCMDPYSTV